MGYNENSAPTIASLYPDIVTSASQETPSLGAELLDATGWTSTGWTGDFASGFTHTAGNTSALQRTVTIEAGKYYLLSFVATPATSSSSADITVALGGADPTETYKGSGASKTYTFGIKALTTGDLVITPPSAYNGKLSAFSCKEITSTLPNTLKVTDSANAIALEMRATTAALSNLFIGVDAGKSNVTGLQNVGIGKNTLKVNPSGFWNTAVGYNALALNTVGSRNVAVGNVALQSNISGHRNTAVGNFALSANTYGTGNVAIGADALLSNTTGARNIAIGESCLWSNVTGVDNVGIGRNALSLNTGNQNIGIGSYALMNNTGTDNVNIGFNAGYYNRTGNQNTTLGSYAGRCATSGTPSISDCTMLGFNTGRLLQDAANQNTFIGSGAGATHLTGTGNILIGYNTTAPATSSSNRLNIGGTIYGDLATDHVGIGVETMTAVLHLKAAVGGATANSASLKIDAGTLLTTPEAGAIEFDGTNLYFTTGAGARKTLSVVA